MEYVSIRDFAQQLIEIIPESYTQAQYTFNEVYERNENGELEYGGTFAYSDMPDAPNNERLTDKANVMNLTAKQLQPLVTNGAVKLRRSGDKYVLTLNRAALEHIVSAS